MTSREEEVLAYVAEVGDTTVDEFMAAHPRRYVNSWAPVFTALRQRGLLRRTGLKRATRYGSYAFVLTSTHAEEAA